MPSIHTLAHLQARSELWEKRIQAVATACGVDLSRLPALKSGAEKLRVAAVMKRVTSVSNRWLAERQQMGRPTSVGPLVHPFKQSGERTRVHSKRFYLDSQFDPLGPAACDISRPQSGNIMADTASYC